jgi:hypothetical protein
MIQRVAWTLAATLFALQRPFSPASYQRSLCGRRRGHRSFRCGWHRQRQQALLEQLCVAADNEQGEDCRRDRVLGQHRIRQLLAPRSAGAELKVGLRLF